ncbi:male sterility protein [Krasilnikovia cinnamomea]|uniref:Male sterility protein n=1 Tax=Krasilnikovia cinnamomea TaxID=349313 RepID=A0A4Q7ZV46_9ACTN|nr:SDR family oxidoreductase [Krasilnikovia cinnamomea]RZU54523.1 male sterility protein [Krasilnikovia cinnamomea]
MTDGRILVTGANGYLGRHVARHLLTHTDRPLLLWARAGTAAEARAKVAPLLRDVPGAADRVRYTGGDLSGDDPFAGVATGDLTAIVHTAAVTSFTVEHDVAQRVNTAGTARLLELARRCPRLDSVCLFSSLYATGLQAGPITELPAPVPSAGFANAYERSKWAAEAYAFGQTDLPVSVLRVATVLADDESGRAGQHNAVHNTLRLLRLGLLGLMPGLPDTPVYLTTADVTARAAAAAVSQSATGVFHVADRAADSLTLARTMDVAFDVFGADPGFARRRVARPEYADLHSYTLLADSSRSFGASVLGQALTSLLPFAAQLYVAKDVANDRLRALLPDHRPLDAAALLAATCRNLLADARSPDVRR